MLALGFISVCMYSCVCACVSQCLYELLCFHLRFPVFVWTLVLALVFLTVLKSFALVLAFLGVHVDSWGLRLRFSMFVVWTLVLALEFSSVCMNSCACICVFQCLYGLLCLRLCFSLFYSLLRLRLRFSVFMWTLGACPCVSQCLPYGLLCFRLRFPVSVCMNSCAYACISQSLYGILHLRLRFSVFMFTRDRFQTDPVRKSDLPSVYTRPFWNRSGADLNGSKTGPWIPGPV